MLTLEQAVAEFPQLLNDTPSPEVSRHFDVIPTVTLIEPLVERGWQIAGVTVQLPREPKLVPAAAHRVRLTLPGTELVVGNTFPMAEITNSARGHHALKATAGLFRLLCGNGMTSPVLAQQPVHIRHRALELAEVLDVEYRILDDATTLADRVSRLQEIEVTPADQIRYATMAGALRWPEGMPIPAEDLLHARRSADQGDSAWLIFNRVQENLLRGGQQGRLATGRRTTVRPIGSLAQETELNARLLHESVQFFESLH